MTPLNLNMFPGAKSKTVISSKRQEVHRDNVIKQRVLKTDYSKIAGYYDKVRPTPADIGYQKSSSMEKSTQTALFWTLDAVQADFLWTY